MFLRLNMAFLGVLTTAEMPCFKRRKHGISAVVNYYQNAMFSALKHGILVVVKYCRNAMILR